tara:strand:- start:1880 stop:2653 length:774 start_codon:yes stop_codon:yes gene_type:complete
MYTIDLSGKTALVFGIANQRSIAWSITKSLHNAGASIIAAYQNDRVKPSVDKLTSELDRISTVECDVSDDRNVEKTFGHIKEQTDKLDIVVHSIAFAQREDLGGRFLDTDREGFRVALDISAYSLVSITRNAFPMMTEGGSILTMSFMAAEKVFPGYNVMSTAKAALENEVRQLANDLGPNAIRVNAISAGPLDTLSSRVISGYRDMKKAHSDRAPMRRNITHDEVANTALFLSSNMSTGITGEVIHVDTGYHVMGI